MFDLDGTLWEVTDLTYESANEVARRHGLKEVKKDTVCKAFGLNKVQCAQMYFKDLELNTSLDLMDEISKIKIARLNEKGGNLYPDVSDTIMKLSEQYDLFIVSNTSKKEYIEAFLKTSKLEKYFKDYIAAGANGITKASAIKSVIDKFNLSKAVYVGDTVKDMEAADEAGVTFIQARYGYGSVLNVKYHINSVAELKKLC